LGSPELLLLDEPTTGLDPAHIREVRAAIADCAARGVTVVLSSHLLSEVEQVCSHVAIIQRGRVIANGAVADLVGRRRAIRLEVDDAGRAAEILSELSEVSAAWPNGRSVLVEGSSLRPANMLLTLDEAKIRTDGFRRGHSLEEAYLSLVDQGAGAPAGEVGESDS
jgi:ABC-2 type transport system ATP-binding protein